MRFGIVEYLSTNLPKIKTQLEHNTGKVRTNLQVSAKKVNTENVSDKEVIVRVRILNLSTPPGVPSRVGQ